MKFFRVDCFGDKKDFKRNINFRERSGSQFGFWIRLTGIIRITVFELLCPRRGDMRCTALFPAVVSRSAVVNTSRRLLTQRDVIPAAAAATATVASTNESM